LRILRDFSTCSQAEEKQEVEFWECTRSLSLPVTLPDFAENLSELANHILTETSWAFPLTSCCRKKWRKVLQ
jgi:hypothetical protein